MRLRTHLLLLMAASLAAACDSFGFAVLDASDVSLRDNLADGEGVSGFFVSSRATNFRLTRNTARWNHDDGFTVDAPGTKLTGNTATDNREMGIRCPGSRTAAATPPPATVTPAASSARA